MLIFQSVTEAEATIIALLLTIAVGVLRTSFILGGFVRWLRDTLAEHERRIDELEKWRVSR